MKHLFKLLVGILVLGLLVVVTACVGDKDKSDYSFCVRVDDVVIDSIMLDDADKIDIFKDAFNGEDLLAVEFVEFGKKVYLDFNGNKPDEIEVWDSIITSEGDYMYDQNSSIKISCESDVHGYYFVVNKHPASGFSSISEDGRFDLRGYRVVAKWGGDVVVYGFVIKTIASN